MFEKVVNDNAFKHEIENVEISYKKNISVSADVKIPAGEISVVSYKKIL